MEYDPLYLSSTEFTQAGIMTAAQIWALLNDDIENGLFWVADLAWTGDSDLEFKAETLLELMVRYDAAEVVTQLSKLVINMKVDGAREENDDLVYLAELLQEISQDLGLELRLPETVVIRTTYEWPATTEDPHTKSYHEEIVVSFD